MYAKRILFGAACLLSTSAMAADLPIVEPVYVAPLYDWNGFYAGINAGFGGGTFEHPFDLDGWYYPGGEEQPYWTDLLDGSIDVTAGGFVGGVQAGYNWQFDESFLIGIEADIQGSSIDGRVSLSLDDDFDTLDLDADAGTSLDWFATLRPRVGWVSDRFVVYGTGGLAWGSTTSSVNAEINGIDILDELGVDNEIENDRFGWTIGAGVEYAITDMLTFKTEYLYTDLGSEEIIGWSDEGSEFSLDSDVAFHTVRAGLNFQF